MVILAAYFLLMTGASVCRMLNIYHSNKLEVLAAQLSALSHFKPLPPMFPEQIMVESSAMGHWLTDQIAQQAGIAANIEFPFPAALVWNIYRQQMPDLASQSSFDRQPLQWRLYQLFTDNVTQLNSPELADSDLLGYLDKLSSDRQRLDFSTLLANLYDQYQIYRPDWLIDWRNGGVKDADAAPWQAKLWQLLCQLEPDQDDRASIFSRSLEQFPLSETQGHNIAQRLNIFAVSTLAKNYLELFSALAKTIDVNVYVLNPCAVYWDDVRSERQRLKYADGLDAALSSEESANNDLLALLAKQSREFVQMLESCEHSQSHELFVDVDPPSPSLLECLQQDILHLRQANPDTLKRTLSAEDHSIQLHSCHSPLREVQVLHNQVLAFLAENPNASYGDVVIMVPDLERYAPFFHAVFACADSALRFPYHLAERGSGQLQGMKAVLMQLLKLSDATYKREAVLALFEEPAVMRRFGITDLSVIHQLLEDLQLHSGLQDEAWLALADEHSSAAAIVSFSWQQARDRLLSSYVIAEPESGLSGWMDSDLIAGVDDDIASQAGLLCDFIDQLIALQSPSDFSLQNWLTHVEVLISSFMLAEEETELQQLRSIRKSCEKMLEDVELAKFDSVLPRDIFSQQLESYLQQDAASHFFKSGAVNVATLLPLRSIPFKMIAVLGLNDGEFPRPAGSDQLDLMLHSRRAGDRNRREEDRYLFLEALLASRQCCHFSFIGRSQIDNSERYPSLLLTELLTHIDKHYCSTAYDEKSSTSASMQLLTQHALQSFDRSYFEDVDGPLFSYDSHALQQCLALQSADSHMRQFYTEPLAVELSEVDGSYSLNDEKKPLVQWPLKQLVAALHDPSAWLLQQLGISTNINESQPAQELFAANGLTRFQGLPLLFDGLQQGAPIASPLISAEALCRQGLLPQTAVGAIEYTAMLSTAQCLWQQCQAHHLNDLRGTQAIEVEIDTGQRVHQISGALQRFNTRSTQRIAWLGRKLHGGHVVKAWMEHLLCQLQVGHCHSYLIDEAAVYRMDALPAENAKVLLQDLLTFIEVSAGEPSWFFAQSAWQYLNVLEQKGEEKALAELESKLLGNERLQGEWYKTNHYYVYRGIAAVDLQCCQQAAESVLAPLMDYWQELT